MVRPSGFEPPAFCSGGRRLSGLRRPRDVHFKPLKRNMVFFLGVRLHTRLPVHHTARTRRRRRYVNRNLARLRSHFRESRIVSPRLVASGWRWRSFRSSASSFERASSLERTLTRTSASNRSELAPITLYARSNREIGHLKTKIKALQSRALGSSLII